MSLARSTRQADSVRPECLCVRECATGCSGDGRWHNHIDEVCSLHPTTLIDTPTPQQL